MPFKYGIAVAKLHCSNYTFGIEACRHVHREQRICMFWFQKLKNKKKIDVNFTSYYWFDEIRAVFLFNWSIDDTNIADLYTLLQNENPDVIKTSFCVHLCVNENIDKDTNLSFRMYVCYNSFSAKCNIEVLQTILIQVSQLVTSCLTWNQHCLPFSYLK